MKFGLVLVLAGVLLASCAGEQRSGKKFMGLAGKVESMKETQYKAEEKAGEIVEGEQGASNVYKFNEDGLLVCQESYWGGRKGFWREFEYEGDVPVKDSWQMTNGNWLIEYKLVGRTDTERTYERKEFCDGVLRSQDMAEETFDVAQTRFVRTRKDEEGKVIYREETSYDDRGCLVETKAISDGRVTVLRTAKYNRQCEQVKSSEKMGDGLPTTYTHEYRARDEKGNWTEMVMFVDGKAKSITKRKITYVE